MIGTTVNKIATVLLAGYTDNHKYIRPIDIAIKQLTRGLGSHYPYEVFYYNYNRQSDEIWKFAKFAVMRRRFRDFLRDHGFLESDVKLNIVGYSTGAMIALYAAGIYQDIREISPGVPRINKFVSIASPHNGAKIYNLMGLGLGIPFLGVGATAGPGLFLGFGLAWLIVTNTGITAEMCKPKGYFLTTRYPNAAQRVFDVTPKEDMLQIWTEKDGTAKPESAKRFLEHMVDHHVAIKAACPHLALPQDDATVAKVIEYVFDYETYAISVEPTSGVPGTEVQVSGKVEDLARQFPLYFGDGLVETEWSDTGIMTFHVPDDDRGGIPVRIDVELPDVTCPVMFMVLPYLSWCEPSRGFAGDEIKVRGEIEETDVLFLDDEETSSTFGTDDIGPYLAFTVPDDELGDKQVHVQRDGQHNSNVLTITLCDLIGNINTKELHKKDCSWLPLMKPENKWYLCSPIDRPREKGYDNCHWCIGGSER